MNREITVVLSVLVPLCYFVVNRLFLDYLNLPSEKGISISYNVISGVLSARQNFQQRMAVRKTWMKEMVNFSSRAYFIIGKYDCFIPPEDRLHPHSCNEWMLKMNSGMFRSEFFPLCESKKSECELPEKIYPGVSFRVQHPVIVEHLGVLATAVLEDSKFHIAILEGTTKKIIVKAEFDTLRKGHYQHGYLFRRVEAYILPKGFEGILMVEGITHLHTCNIAKWRGDGVITVTKVYQNNNDYDSISFVDNATVAPGMLFRIHDVPELEMHVQRRDDRRKDWQKVLQQVEERLSKESEEWNDIIFVDTVDVYGNLAAKLLEFYEWVSENRDFKYILKTDDDCLMNIDLIAKKLEHIGDNIWWSKFRKNWPVNYFGKWADHEYSSLTYPMFACGAGNILSRNLVLWLSQNKLYLHPYQGEDVSVGIWLAALKPNYIDDELWLCDNSCENSSYNLAEVKLEDMDAAWKNYLLCGSFCYCST